MPTYLLPAKPATEDVVRLCIFINSYNLGDNLKSHLSHRKALEGVYQSLLIYLVSPLVDLGIESFFR